MMQGIQLFQPSLNGLGQEVAQVELPGELWSAVEALAEREQTMFIDYRPQELAATCSCSRTVNIAEFLQRRGTTAHPEPSLELIQPYVQEALDLGYNHVILTA